MEYPMTAAREVLKAKEATRGVNEKVRFLFISGILSVKDQKKRLWFLEEGRRARVSSPFIFFTVARPRDSIGGEMEADSRIGSSGD
jgi:hypothetical protein